MGLVDIRSQLCYAEVDMTIFWLLVIVGVIPLIRFGGSFIAFILKVVLAVIVIKLALILLLFLFLWQVYMLHQLPW